MIEELNDILWQIYFMVILPASLAALLCEVRAILRTNNQGN